VRKDHREVSPLARQGMSSVGGLTFYPPHYRAALACSLILPPLSHGPFLRATVPSSVVCEAGRTTGLPRSADVPEWGRSRLYAGGSSSAPQEFGACEPVHVPFWPKRDSSLRLFLCDDAYDASDKLTWSTRSWFPTALLLVVAMRTRVLNSPPQGGGYVVPGASHSTVTGAARPGRILLAEQQVLSVGPPTAIQLHRRLRVAPERPSSAAGPAGECSYLGKP
jgi:hypothetical protein